MKKNEELFKKISTIHGEPLTFSLDRSFEEGLNSFRTLTSKLIDYNKCTYPSVYLSDKDYGGLTIHFSDDKELRLVVNFEFYYVYGMFIDDDLYAFKGEACEALVDFGFEPKEIPYGDAYYDIDEGLSKKQLEDLKNTSVTLTLLYTSLGMVIDPSVGFDEKREALLIVFWSLVEGIRFAYISNTINALLNGYEEERTYNDFYELAETWADLCVAAAKKGVLDDRIAVYDLHRLEN